MAILLFTALPTGVEAQSYATSYDDDGTIVVNGDRRFILGTYGITWSDDGDYHEAMREYAAAGFNLAYVRGTNDGVLATAAAANGLMTWTTVGAPRDPANTQSYVQKVRRASSLPGLAFVETVDEPAWTLQKPEERVSPEAVIRGYSIIKDLIPDRLVYLNHAPTNLVSTLQRYNDGTDIVAVDVYPVMPHGLILRDFIFEDGLQGDLNNPYISQVGEYVRKMRHVAGPGRPVFSVQQAFAWAMMQPEDMRDENKILYPTHEELRFMAYQAIVESATGILYWGEHLTPKPSRHWDAVTRVVRELADMESVLTARSVATSLDVQYHELGHSVDDGLSMLIKDVDDVRYLIACNADRYPCRATISGFGEWRSVTVLTESRAISSRDETLTDTWPAFGVHVYRMER